MLQTEVIKNAYRINFSKEISDEKALEILNVVLERTRAEISKLPDFTEGKLKRYLSGNLQLTFSPAAVFVETTNIINDIGIDEFERSDKYKKAREMEVAARLCLAQKKLFGEEWGIKIQDNPDVILVKHSSRSMDENFMDGVRLEIMRVPQIAKRKWNQDFTSELVKFIREKKFLKRYGNGCSLLINLDFDQRAVNFADVAREIKNVSTNPYYQIWITATVNENGKIAIMQLYPNLYRVDFDPTIDGHLLY